MPPSPGRGQGQFRAAQEQRGGRGMIFPLAETKEAHFTLFSVCVCPTVLEQDKLKLRAEQTNVWC